MARRWMGTAVATLALLGLTAAAPPTATQPPKPIFVQWAGHATFRIVSPGGTHILIDPFILQNPAVPDSMKNLALYKPNVILVTHSHGDHSADAKVIATATGAPVISTYEWVDRKSVV